MEAGPLENNSGVRMKLSRLFDGRTFTFPRSSSDYVDFTLLIYSHSGTIIEPRFDYLAMFRIVPDNWSVGESEDEFVHVSYVHACIRAKAILCHRNYVLTCIDFVPICLSASSFPAVVNSRTIIQTCSGYEKKDLTNRCRLLNRGITRLTCDTSRVVTETSSTVKKGSTVWCKVPSKGTTLLPCRKRRKLRDD